jgi:hypothetical protein
MSISWNFRAHQYDRIQRAREVELGFVGLRLERLLEGPLLGFSHAAILTRSAPFGLSR